MNVLVVGLGHIGAPKAQVYSEYGLNVYYYDHVEKETKFQRLDKDQIGQVDFDIIDICSPTELHIPHLAKFLKAYPKATYLIEKPLCGTKKDLRQFKALVAQYPETVIIYSENCIFSTVIAEVEKMLEKRKLQVHSVQIEFSKDRREDIVNGRTVDLELEGFGRDIPHALMVLNELKVNINHVNNIIVKDLIVEDKIYPRQGLITISGQTAAGQHVDVYQSLDGIYVIKKPYYVVPTLGKNKSTAYRVVDIDCGNGRMIGVQLEPIEGKERFVSRVMYIENNIIKEIVEVADNNLRVLIKHVLQVIAGEVTLNRYVKAQYAIHITEALLKMQQISTKEGRRSMNLVW